METASSNGPLDIGSYPPNLSVIFIAGNHPIPPEFEGWLAGSDLVITLGGVDLNGVASRLPEGFPALCLAGPDEELSGAPSPFVYLHGSGVHFPAEHGWDIVGISGRASGQPGMGVEVSEEEAEQMFARCPTADLLVTAMPPAGINEDGSLDTGLQAITNELSKRPPFYHFYAAPPGQSETSSLDATETFFCGVVGAVPAVLTWG